MIEALLAAGYPIPEPARGAFYCGMIGDTERCMRHWGLEGVRMEVSHGRTEIDLRRFTRQ